jgi:hypothetical protein
MLLFVSDAFDDGVNVMYLVDAEVVATVSTWSAPDACPFIVVHVTVPTVSVPEPVIPLPMVIAGTLGWQTI